MMPVNVATRIYKACQFAEISGEFPGEQVCKEMQLMIREYASVVMGRESDPERVKQLRKMFEDLELLFDE